MIEPHMKQLKGDAVHINAAMYNGGKKAVLCLHGITANCRSWDMIAQALIPEHTVIALDLRGRGASDKPASGYSPDHHIRDIICVMDALRIERVYLMGHSLGAFISLVFAAKHPERVEKLVLVDGGGNLGQQQLNHVFEAIRSSLERLEKTFESRDAYINHMKSNPHVQPWMPHIETHYQYEIQKGPSGFTTNINPVHIQEESVNVRKIDCNALYGKVQCPTLILRASKGLLSQKDLLLPEDTVNQMMSKIANAQRFDVKGVNHYGIVFAPHKDRDNALMSFLSGKRR